jgi:hypothetical protein
MYHPVDFWPRYNGHRRHLVTDRNPIMDKLVHTYREHPSHFAKHHLIGIQTYNVSIAIRDCSHLTRWRKSAVCISLP